MKKYLQTNLMWMLTLLVALAASAQSELKEEIPFDESVRTGTLDNGLKYFIKKNSKPENRVELRLAVNAGSILEDDDQLGLAHFTEHMAFNGSKNFEKNELVSYLQSVGVKFGAHLNAYTSFDETVYILPIPSDDEEILEKGLTILEDWSGGLSFDPEELEKERGVVIEEWRLGQGAQMRMLQKYLPVIFKGSQYAERLPIGTKETLENFDLETIKRFYSDWYRPNLMAVIAVGDIDVDKMEERIKNHFSKLENPKKPRERKEFDLPDNEEPLVSITSDPEEMHIRFNIMYKTDAQEFTTVGQFRKMFVNNLFLSMMNQRLSDLLTEANPPYLYATTYLGSPVSRKKTAFAGFAVPKPDDVKTGVVRTLEEVRRVEQHGFNPSELTTAKLRMMEGYEKSYKERDKTESAGYANELIRHFLEKEPVPGIEYEYEFAQKYVEGITLEEVNALVSKLITEKNRIVYMTAPEKEGITLPTEEEILAWVAETEDKQMEPLEEKVIDTNLVKEEITPGKVVETSTIENLDVDILTLSNGAKIYLKETDFKNDEIRFSAYRPTGTSVVSDEDYWSASFAEDIVNTSGIGEYSRSDLEKALAGKSVSLSPYCHELEASMVGSASPKDIETLLQLVYLNFTAVRKDEDAYQSFIKRNEGILGNLMSNPNYYYQDKRARILSQNHLRGGGIPTVENVKSADLDKALDFFKSQYSSPGDFTFWFFGSINKEELVPMLEKYLGSISASGSDMKWKDNKITTPEGKLDEKIYAGTEPKSMVNIYFTDEFKYSRKENYYLSCLSEVLDIKLIEILREEKGGVYGVGANFSSDIQPTGRYTMSIGFPCGPENVDSLTVAAIKVIRDIQENGVTEEDLGKIKETQRRDLEVNLKKNSYWLNYLRFFHVNDIDYDEFPLTTERIDALTAKDIQKVAKKYIDTEEYIRVTLYPEEMKENK